MRHTFSLSTILGISTTVVMYTATNSMNGIGSFHVNSTNFWMFFDGPPRIVLKFGTVVEHRKKKPH